MKKLLWVIGIILVLAASFASFALYKALEEDKYPASYNIWKDPDMRTYYANEQKWRDVLLKATANGSKPVVVSPQELLLRLSFKYPPDDKGIWPYPSPGFKWVSREELWSFQIAFESKIQHSGEFRVENWHLQNYPSIGIKMEEISTDAISGLVIVEVFKDSPAEKSGLKPGDRILEIDGKQIRGINEADDAIHNHKIGENVRLKIAVLKERKFEYKIIEVPVKSITFSTDPKNPQDTKLRLISPEKAWHQNCPVRFTFTLWEGYNLKGVDTKGKEYTVERLKIRTAFPQGNFDYDRLRKGHIDDLSKVLLQAQNTFLPIKIKGVIDVLEYTYPEDKNGTIIIEELTIHLLVTDAEIVK